MALDQSPSFANLFPQHEVAFSVHHQLLVNPLEFELVVSVVVVAVVFDLVSIPGAHVLVVVLVHLVSPVVLVLDKIAVVVDPFVIAVSMVATRTVVAHVVFFRRRLCRWLLLCQILLSGCTMFGALIGIVSFNSHQQLIRHCLKFSQFVANTCHCFPPVPSPDDEILNRNVHS